MLRRPRGLLPAHHLEVRLMAVQIGQKGDAGLVVFVKLAQAYDIEAYRVDARPDVVPTVERARAAKGPVLIEFQVQKEDAVYPMVPAGSDLHAMIRRPAEAGAEVRS
jgi:thiamine pyrophosphate-dependent acetolactate synthase large subunit-like protein